MSERQIGEQLLEFDPNEQSPKEIARRVVGHDRLMSRCFSAGIVFVWLVAAGLMFPIIAHVRKTMHEFSRTMTAVVESTEVESDLPSLINQDSMSVFARSAAVSVVLMGVAAVLTLLLIRSTRRATLRQLNANLLAISEQLQRMQPPKSP